MTAARKIETEVIFELNNLTLDELASPGGEKPDAYNLIGSIQVRQKDRVLLSETVVFIIFFPFLALWGDSCWSLYGVCERSVFEVLELF